MSIGAAILIILYFVPAFVADKRKHPNRYAIAWLNILLGWTVVFWVISLVWSLTAFEPHNVRDGATGPRSINF